MGREKLYLTLDEIQDEGYLFKNKKEIADYLAKNEFSKAALYQEKLWYKGAASNYQKSYAQVVGKVNDIACIIKVEDKYLKIHIDYLREMNEPHYAVRGQKLDKNSLPESYVLYDVETTGKYKLYDQIVEIGALKVVNHEIVDTYHSLIYTDRKISKDAFEKHGITNEMLVGQPTIKEIAPVFLEFIDGFALVGYNISTFDNFLIAEGFETDLMNNYLDVLYKMAQNSEKLKNLQNKKMETIMKYLGMGDETHRALQDCFDEYVVYEYLAFDREPQRILVEEYMGEEKANAEDNIFLTLDLEPEHEKELDENDIVYEFTKQIVDSAFEECHENELELKPLTTTKINKSGKTTLRKGTSFSCYGNVWFRFSNDLKTKYRFEIKHPGNVDKHEKVRTIIKEHYELNNDKGGKGFFTFDVEKGTDSYSVLKSVMDNIREALYITYLDRCENEEVGDKFGCCSRHIACSDNMKCYYDNVDIKYAKRCMYRDNLYSGKIFYGKNKNI